MSLARSGADIPARGTRPRNRRALILASATELFYDFGYDHVDLSDIAAAVGIGASALYRHFTGKQQLLAAVIFEGFEPTHALLDNLNLDDIDRVLHQMAALALNQRRIGLLWDRDSRSMTPEDRQTLRKDIIEIVRQMTKLVGAARPGLDAPTLDLLASALLAVFVSPSYHHLELPRYEYEDLLVELGRRIVFCPIEYFVATKRSVVKEPLIPVSRREAILAEASRLFAKNGYAGVSLEDIGTSLGITGSSLYNHLDSKAEILLTSLQRGAAYLMLDLNHALSSTNDPAIALEKLIDSYIRMITTHTDVIDLLITQSRQLPESVLRDERQIQRDYVTEWMRLLGMRDSDPHLTAARIRVQAALTVVNNTARTSHLHSAEGFSDAIRVVVRSLLAAPNS